MTRSPNITGSQGPAALDAPEGESARADREEAERRAIFESCERFIWGHGPQRPHEVLVRLAEEVGEDERPDSYGAGKLIDGFEREVAGLLGKEAAVFMPSGTMAQQIAVRIWADRRGTRTIAFHPTCHLEIHEAKGYAHLHGLHGLLVGNPRQLLTLADLEAVQEPVAALLLELPQREIGGQLPAWEDLQAQTAWARERNAALHLDGARLWEAAPFYGRPYAEIAALFDSVYVSFYKGAGGIAGAILSGPADFIAEARVWQRRHGGNLVQLFPYVLAARSGLRQRLGRFPTYCERAVAVARTLAAIPGVAVKPDPPQTNMMHVYLRGDRERLVAASLAIGRTERVALFSNLRPTDVPDHWYFELVIGDAAAALTDDEIGALFRRVMEVTSSDV